MAGLKSVATIVFLYLLIVPRSFAQQQFPGLPQSLGWPPPGPSEPQDAPREDTRWAEEANQRAVLAEDARRSEEESRRVEAARRTEEEARQKALEWIFGPPPTPEQEETRRREALLAAAEKNYRAMTEAATELAALSNRISDEINVNGQRVVSKRMLKDLETLEKLAKEVRNRGKRLPKT